MAGKGPNVSWLLTYPTGWSSYCEKAHNVLHSTTNSLNFSSLSK